MTRYILIALIALTGCVSTRRYERDLKQYEDLHQLIHSVERMFMENRHRSNLQFNIQESRLSGLEKWRDEQERVGKVFNMNESSSPVKGTVYMPKSMINSDEDIDWIVIHDKNGNRIK